MLAAIGSVRAQSLPAHELIVVVDHNTELLGRLARAISAPGPRPAAGQGRGQPSSPGDCPAARTLASGTPPATSWPSSTTTRSPTPTGSSTWPTTTATPEVTGVGGLTLAELGHRAARLVPARVRLGGRLQLPGHAGVARSRSATCSAATPRSAARCSTRPAASPVGIGRSAAKLPLGCEETEFCIRIGQPRPGRRC